MAKKCAVVTGANRGIGKEIAWQLGKQGFRVVLGIRNQEEGQKTESEMRENGLDVIYHSLDVGSQESRENFVAWLSKDVPKVDALINNAGILIDEPAGGGILKTPLSVIEKTFNINVLGALHLAQGIIPLMKGQGDIVNLSSGLGQLSEMGGGYPAYRISKTALNAVTKILDAELAEHDIYVNSVCPGWVRTDMGGPNAHRAVEKGAETPVWLVTERPGIRGQFLRDKEIIPW